MASQQSCPLNGLGAKDSIAYPESFKEASRE